MMGPETILSMQREAAERAAVEGMEPMVLFAPDTALEDIRRSPFIGDYEPEGWKPARLADYASSLDVAGLLDRVERAQLYGADRWEQELLLFADSSGLAGSGEPALGLSELGRVASTLCEAAAERGVTLGFAVVEAGQFQVYLRGFEKEAA